MHFNRARRTTTTGPFGFVLDRRKKIWKYSVIYTLVLISIVILTTRRYQTIEWHFNDSKIGDYSGIKKVGYRNIILSYARYYSGLSRIIPPITFETNSITKENPNIDLIVSVIQGQNGTINKEDILWIIKYDPPEYLRGIKSNYMVMLNNHFWYALHVDGTINIY